MMDIISACIDVGNVWGNVYYVIILLLVLDVLYLGNILIVVGTVVWGVLMDVCNVLTQHSA